MIMIMIMMTVITMRQARRNAMDGKKGTKNFKRHKIPSCTIVIFFIFLFFESCKIPSPIK